MNWWISRQKNDPFVKQRQHDQYRSRAAYKLKQIVEKYKLQRFKGPFVDLGAAPGGWSQVMTELWPNSMIVACDLLPMDNVPRVHFILGDFLEAQTHEKLAELLNHKKVQGIFSDMSPNLSGNALVEQAQLLSLTEQIEKFAVNWLAPKGFLVQKVFHGQEFQTMQAIWKKHFARVHIVKPEASRSESAEVYFFCEGFLQ